jgi:diaminopimelate decarboxylase
MSKFGHKKIRDDIASDVFGVSVDELVSRFNSPLFVTSERKLRHNIQRIKRTFEHLYPDVIHGWSYKTNYTSAVCNILHQEGSWAEVVSKFEYEKARALGVPAENIIFNGPNKPRDILTRAVAEGAYINADHMSELQLLETIASEQGKTFSIGLRVNFNTGFSQPWSRFGFNLESGQLHEAVRWIDLSPHLKLNGLHCHIGTFVLEPRAYFEETKTLCRLMQEFEDKYDIEIDIIDIGGGFPSRNALQQIYLPPEQAVPDINEYCEAVCDALLDGTQYRAEQGRRLPRLIFESGRAVVDDAQVLICTVVGTKRLPDGQRAAILDAGTNLLFTAYWYNHQIRLTRETTGAEEETVLYGPLCMNIDVVRHSIYLPPLVAGDRLVISHVGAYNNSQWQQFIEYRPNVVLIDETSQCSIIRKAEDLSVMMAQDQLPEHLQSLYKQSARASKSSNVEKNITSSLVI